MRILWRIIYNLVALPLMILAAYALAAVNRKVRRGLRGRRGVLQRARAFRDSLYDRYGPVYWFHMASHGEFEQTRLVIEGLRDVIPESIVVGSFFSPSGYENCHHKDIDLKLYLPLDFPWTMRSLLGILKPQQVIFTSYDLWPNFVWSCRRAGVPTTLFAARVVSGSSKQWPLLSNFYRHIYGAMAHIYTVSSDDHRRISRIIGRRAKTRIMMLGNPRYDRVMERSANGGQPGRKNRERVVVLGSVQKSDEDIIVPPILSELAKNPDLRILWAPHEPTQEVIHALAHKLEEAGIGWERFGRSRGKFRQRQVLIIDGVGYLAELYGRGILAYVGGGFGFNVHNLMEPAIARIPIIFGPRYARSHEAEQLLECGGGVSISSSEEFERWLRSYLEDDDLRRRAGDAALRMIEENLGATTRVLQAILGD